MISELLLRSYVVPEMRKRVARLREFAEKLRQGDAEATDAAAKQAVTEEEIEAAVRQLEEAIRRDDAEQAEGLARDDSDVYIPSDPEACMFQVWAEQVAEELKAIEPEPTLQGLADEEVIFTKRRLRRAPEQPEKKGLIGDFVDGSDICYLADGLLAKMVTGVRKKRPFNDRAAQTWKMADDSRLWLLGDWGTGIERAQLIGRMMRSELEAARNQREQHVIHLGDVYYAGWASEYEKRFLPWWPVRGINAATFGSWALNGNHDMYSGGFGFYDTLLAEARFGRQRDEQNQPSSFFLMENEHWQVFGLDTAWLSPDFKGTDGDLAGTQADWMARERARAPHKGCVVLTHHQLFSARHNQGHSPKVERKLRHAGVRDGIDAWIWGHEHRCVVHQRDFGGVPFSCCLGHGGVPVKAEPPGTPLPTGVAWEYREAIVEGVLLPRYYARFGYASLTFRGAEIDFRIFGEDGQQKWPLPGHESDGVIRKQP
jgi:Calcineurin-like phosphoesterase